MPERSEWRRGSKRTGANGTPDSTTSYFMGGQYEVKDGATKKYYSIAGMMVAVNDGTGLQYLVSTGSTRRLTDHLGSTVAVTNSSGTLTSQQRYLPFGAARTIPNSPIAGTDFTYTGQRLLDSGMGGIMDYRARFYSPALGRFIQPDAIVPNIGNPQNLNRSCYVGNNPTRYSDPSGHARLSKVASNQRVDPKRKPICNDKRDLTDWMPRGLTYMANYPKIKEIGKTRALFLSAHLPEVGYIATGKSFKTLVEDKSPFDIKRTMWRAFGEQAPIKLGDSWYENSTPGNIAYGFYGVAAGYDPLVLHMGAGYAQSKDAYLDKDGPPGDWRYLMDTRDDFAAVELGITLYNEDYLPDHNLTQEEFVNRLDSFDLIKVRGPRNGCQPSSGPYSDDEFIFK